MDCPLPATDPLWSFLWGKRESRRHPVNLRAEIRSSRAVLPARTVDLSASGVLIAVEERILVRALAEPHAGVLRGLPEALGGGFRLRFPGRHVGTSASVVRIAWRADDRNRLYLGCRFDRPLDDRHLRRLGLSTEACLPESGTEARLSSDMAFQGRADRPILLEVWEGKRLLMEGPLVAAEGRAISTTLAGADPTELAARLSRHSLRVVARDGTRPLWADDTYLLAIRRPEALDDAVEVVLLAKKPISDAVTTLLAPRDTLASA